MDNFHRLRILMNPENIQSKFNNNEIKLVPQTVIKLTCLISSNIWWLVDKKFVVFTGKSSIYFYYGIFTSTFFCVMSVSIRYHEHNSVTYEQWNLSKPTTSVISFVRNRHVFGSYRLNYNSKRFQVLRINLMFGLHRIPAYFGFSL